MSEVATRVAVLGVEGDARAQLRRALAEFGADITIEGDPRQLDPEMVREAAPAFILVSLDDAIEDALDSWQGVFDNPQITVIFDEAAVTRELGGWELARWARHLASKLLGDQAVLLPAPPAHAERLPQSDLQPRPGAPITPEQAMRDARLEDYTQDTIDLAGVIPVNERPGLTPADGAAVHVHAPATLPDAADAMALDVNDAAIELDLNDAAIELALMGRAPLEVERAGSAGSAQEIDDFTLDIDIGVGEAITAHLPAAAPAAPAPAAPADPGLDWAALEAGFDLGGFGEPAAPVEATLPEPVAFEPVHHEPVAPREEDFDLVVELRALDGGAEREPEPSVASADGGMVDSGMIDEFELVEIIEVGESSDVGDYGTAARENAGSGDNTADDDTLELLEFDVGSDSESVSFAQFANEDDNAMDLDPALMAMAAQMEAQQVPLHHSVGEPDFAHRQENHPARAETTAAPAVVAAVPAEPRASSFGNLELAPVDAATSPAAKPSAGPGLDVMDFDALVAGLSLVESDAPAVSTRRGAIAVFAGTGGPDAVRQVLSRLPEELPVPVMVVQRLDAGNHDRLVPQLAKVCPLPVVLAEADRAAAGGAVAVLPTGMGVDVGRHGDIRFAARGQSSSEVLKQLATFGADLVVVIASGADHEITDALAHCLSEGAVVIGQEPSSCFDCAAADQVKNLGGQIGAVGELTAQAVKRWKS